MTYLITQIFLMLLAAALIGMLVGWYLARVSARPTRRALMAKVRELESRLRERRDERRDAPAGGPSASDGPRATPEASPAPGTSATAPAPAFDGEPDDLRRIKGIGPKIAAMLTEVGIRRYEQIAGWTPENVAWVNDHLKFKGRVEREQWISQAQALVAAREGVSPDQPSSQPDSASIS